jgi:hypothetical protein
MPRLYLYECKYIVSIGCRAWDHAPNNVDLPQKTSTFLRFGLAHLCSHIVDAEDFVAAIASLL